MNVYPREYFVPIVVKNRDFLMGFLSCLDNFELAASKFDIILSQSSAKFNDILPGGLRRRNLEFEEQIQTIVEYRINQCLVEDPDSEIEIDEDSPFLEINCECGNYVSFEQADIPHHSHKCDICGKYLIEYTNKNDEDFLYDGDIDKHIDFTDVLDMLSGDDIEEE